MGYHIIDDNPTDPRLLIPYVEFYITNVCNLTCSNCNRFNDYNFKGWQRWSDYEEAYKEWATKVRLQRVTILGGEPLLNPTLLDWVDGINKFWGKVVQVLTNGTHLNRIPDLYDRLIQYSEPLYGAKNWIGISLHNENDRERCFAEIRKFLKGEIRYVKRDDSPGASWASTNGANHAFYDSNGMCICVWEYTSFYTSAIKTNQQGRLTLHNSDPVRAHKSCGFVRYKCYHFIRGGLYKCGPVALFPEFDEQHPLDISEEDRALINAYKPLTVNEFDTRGKEFMTNIDKPIPQCKFCPDDLTTTNTVLFAVSKKKGSTSTYD